MKRLVFILILALTSIIAQAQIPAGYYNNANGKTGDELKIALHNIIKGHHVVSYNGLLNAFAYTDCKTNGKIWDIYSNIEYSPSTGLCGDYEQEGDCWNREHTWPQSWFNEQTTPRTDLFHVYPTDGYVNGQRSNYPYGEVNKPIYTSGNGSKLGPCVTSGYSGKVFEPIDEYKGDIARSYFYMSVRYYSEDNDWGSSGMTNKSEIKPWAMTMLLRWSDEDPVSDKEIARNNAVYGYQNNRNPFIDHPEYAHMIWDENWQGGVIYNITCATGLSHGSVSAPETAMEGTTVSITATPDPGYMVDTYTVYKTGSPSTTVTVSSNGTFTMPSYAVTISATFKVNNTYYNIALGTVSHGSISANTNSAKSGSNITLTATPSSGYSLYSWYVFKTGDMNTTVTVSGNSFVMPAFNVTVMATFVQGNSNGNYVKVTSAPTDWSGEYLIVCESQGVAFNGTIENNWGRCSNVTITNQTIASTTTIDGYKVTISKDNSNYKLLFPSGNYMSWTGEKKFAENNTGQSYSISFSNGDVSISYNDYTVKYNHNSGSGGLRSYASGQTAIQLYKKTFTTQTHTIHFNNNGGSGSMNDQTVNEFEATELIGNTFTRENHLFAGWNTSADGTGAYYADGATVWLFDDATLYAQWEPLYSITIADNIQNGIVSADVNQAIEDQIVTLTATPDSGYEFDHWSVTDASNNDILVTENQFEMPASNVTVSATFVYVGTPFTQKYIMVTSTDQLVAGRTYLIVNITNGKALGTTQNSNNRSAVDVTVSNNVIESIGTTVCELTLGSTNNNWTFFDSTYNNNAGGYLYAASSSNNYLRTQTTNDANGEWTIAISNGNATITAQGSNSRNLLKYNNQSKIFSCYNSGQLDVQLFIRSEEFTHNESETIANLFAFDKHTVASGATLTVSGTAACDDASRLILEDGAQLIHHSDNVMATVKKNIAAYTENGSWYTIAVPFANFTPSQIATASYDLYAYDEDGVEEWINYKADQSGFPVSITNGYLYAHNPTTTLRMTGILNNGNYSSTVNLSHSNSDNTLKGYNLLGNPTAHTITFAKSDNVSDGYYYLSNSEDWIYETGNSVPAGRGFLVKANSAGQSVTLNPQSRGGQTNPYLCISVDDNKAYVKMEEGMSMPLLDFRGKTANLYLTRNGKPYIMLVRDDANSIDLNFKAQENGTHTLTVSETANSNYLHLIDNLTGADIDLLENPSYNFESSSNDIASRFQLKFAANDNATEDDCFAYYADGKIHLFGSYDNAILQVFDITGHQVNTIVPGVYILRLITSERTKVQKLIINK